MSSPEAAAPKNFRKAPNNPQCHLESRDDFTEKRVSRNSALPTSFGDVGEASPDARNARASRRGNAADINDDNFLTAGPDHRQMF